MKKSELLTGLFSSLHVPASEVRAAHKLPTAEGEGGPTYINTCTCMYSGCNIRNELGRAGNQLFTSVQVCI